MKPPPKHTSTCAVRYSPRFVTSLACEFVLLFCSFTVNFLLFAANLFFVCFSNFRCWHLFPVEPFGFFEQLLVHPIASFIHLSRSVLAVSCTNRAHRCTIPSTSARPMNSGLDLLGTADSTDSLLDNAETPPFFFLKVSRMLNSTDKVQIFNSITLYVLDT